MVKKPVNVMIPLGGLGVRFAEDGYSQPKPFIKVLGKEIIFWVIDNLNLQPDDKLYIVYHSSLQKSNFEDTLNRRYPNIHYRKLQSETRGAAETVLLGAKLIEDERKNLPLVCFDGDTFYEKDILDRIRDLTCHGLVCFEDDSEDPIYSYSRVDEDHIILQIAEKEKVSSLANTGCYFFSSCDAFTSHATRVINENIRDKGEFYVSTVIKSMISFDEKFKAVQISKDDFNVLGTPLQVKLFCNSNNQSIEGLRICFDLDNTLVSFPEVEGDYSTCKPISRNIQLLQRLKQEGHTIIIYTARRMKTHKGDVGKVIADIGSLTIETLDKFQIPYDEIYFGKPQANFYIDDLAINPTTQNLEKEMGFFESNIDSRSFNSLTNSSIEVITKSSSNQTALSGEEYWYSNIPAKVAKFFPLYIGKTSSTDQSFMIEKINGIPMTHIHLDELLSKDLLHSLLNTLELIHDSKEPPKDLDYTANYSKKVKKRIESFDYSIFNDYERTIENVIKNLEVFESKGTITPAVIHGDPVFTNILITGDFEIKLIDMRGELDGILTIFGDKWYDFAKVFQSIIGYDEILMGRPVESDYRNKVRCWFEEYILYKYDEQILNSIKVITQSLLLSLIPLHNDYTKQNLFFSLIGDV